jgi:hypothetical protein
MNPWGLLLSLVIGSLGMGFFIYGKKQARIPQIVLGILMMVYPYFISNLWLMSGIALGLVGLLWVGIRMGW